MRRILKATYAAASAAEHGRASLLGSAMMILGRCCQLPHEDELR
jgi:hypothetical protein